MFGIFKKKKVSSTENTIFSDEENEEKKSDEEEKSDEKSTLKIGTGLAASDAAKVSTQQAAKKYAKPSSYNRDLYDSATIKKNTKTKLFNEGKEVLDPYTGDKLELKKIDAKMKYGKENWDKHLAETDHIEPIAKVHEEHKGDLWTTTEDIKNATNSEANVKVVSRKFNNAKRSRTNEEFVEDDAYCESKGVTFTEEGKKQALKDGKVASESIEKQLRKNARKNIISTGHEAGKKGAHDAALMAGTMSFITNIVAVIKGEKDYKTAIKDTTTDTGKAAAVGYGMSSALTVISHSLSNSKSEFIKALVKSNVPGKVITGVMVMGKTFMKYGNGEITTQEFFQELGEKGVNFLAVGQAMAVGQALIPIPVVGAAIGGLIGSVLTSKYYEKFSKELETKELEHQERLRIISECECIKNQAIAYREELESYLQEYFKDYQGCFDEALSDIHSAFQNGDAEGVVAGANKITIKLGGKVKYESKKEFEDYLNDDEIDIL